MNNTLLKRLHLTVLCGLFAYGACDAQSLVADYTFDGKTTSTVGNSPALQLIGSPVYQTESVDGVNRRVLAFSAGDGCRLPDASQTIGNAYTIVVLFRFDSVTSWRRVIDFRNRKTDWGLYSYFGNLNFYNIKTGTGGTIQPDAYVQIALTRNEQGTVRGYVNGLAEIDFSDTLPNATLDADDILSFFQDDTVVPNEHAAGAVSRIRIWDGPLGEKAIAALDRAAGNTSITPPDITSPLEISVNSGDPVSYTLAASNNPIAFSATNLEPWMTFEANSGMLTGTAAAPGIYEIGVSAFNAAGADNRTLRITVNPRSGSSVGFSTENVRVSESSGMIEITVLRNGDAAGTAGISYFTQDGSAIAGVNYSAASGNLNFANGETMKKIRLNLLSNEQREFDKDFILNFHNPVNTIIAQPTQLRIVIEDVLDAPEIVVEQPAGTDLVDGAGTLGFGTAEIGALVTKTVTVRNTGTASLTGIAVTLGGTNAADFAVGALKAPTIAPGSSATFTVRFKPTANGTRSASIQIASNDADENPFTIALSGKGIKPKAPEIAVKQGKELKDNKSARDFGFIKANKSSKAMAFTIKNTGDATLKKIKITIKGKLAKDFKILGKPKATLAPGKSVKFKVIYKPRKANTSKATLQIASNDKDENPFRVKLTGKGVK